MNPYQFFLKHAGYSYDPKTESPMQGRIKTARALAAAERKARDNELWFKWEIDPDCTSADWIADNEDGGRNNDPWQTWICFACSPNESPGRLSNLSTVLASLGGIDFGREGEPWGNSYRRVVEAELALEALENLTTKREGAIS